MTGRVHDGSIPSEGSLISTREVLEDLERNTSGTTQGSYPKKAVPTRDNQNETQILFSIVA